MERRRLLDLPHSDNLIFYAPLDNISGNKEILHDITPITESGCSAAYNSAENKYLLYAYNSSGGNTKAALVYQNIGFSIQNGSPMTMALDMKEVSLYSIYQTAMSCPRYLSAQPCIIRHSFYAANTSPINGRFVVTYSQDVGGSQIGKWYKDGVLIHTQSLATRELSDYVTLCETAATAGHNYRFYAGNARIWNIEMTAEEVANL